MLLPVPKASQTRPASRMQAVIWYLAQLQNHDARFGAVASGEHTGEPHWPPNTLLQTSCMGGVGGSVWGAHWKPPTPSRKPATLTRFQPYILYAWSETNLSHAHVTGTTKDQLVSAHTHKQGTQNVK
jgi:hypothetical protein